MCLGSKATVADCQGSNRAMNNCQIGLNAVIVRIVRRFVAGTL